MNIINLQKNPNSYYVLETDYFISFNKRLVMNVSSRKDVNDIILNNFFCLDDVIYKAIEHNTIGLPSMYKLVPL